MKPTLVFAWRFPSGVFHLRLLTDSIRALCPALSMLSPRAQCCVQSGDVSFEWQGPSHTHLCFLIELCCHEHSESHLLGLSSRV